MAFTVRSASTPPTSVTTTSPSVGSCAISSTRTGSSRRSAGRRPRSWSSPTRRSWPTYAPRSRAMVALHNFGADGSIVPIQLQGVPSGCPLVDLLEGLTEHKLDSEGRIDVDLDGYGYRWLRLRRPEDEPIIWTGERTPGALLT